jgi:hypothetical protein
MRLAISASAGPLWLETDTGVSADFACRCHPDQMKNGRSEFQEVEGGWWRLCPR